jgi:RecJ-like exonuclease
MVNRMKAPVVYTENDEAVELPCKWEICCGCEGHGTDRGASVECDGGGFTSAEWAEQDEDFRADYLAGRYDRPCAACDGTGKVQVVDEDRCKPELLAAYRQQMADDAEIDAIHAAEQRMGA